MFTGIVQGQGKVIAMDSGEYAKVTITLPNSENLRIGDSVSVSGVCLTAVQIQDTDVQFDIIPETLSRTNLKELQIGNHVNIERALKYGDEVGGHLLSGHIMGVGTISNRHEGEEILDISIKVPEEMSPFIVEKGYIAIDGISLTIGKVNGCNFSVHLIPETIRLTTLASKQIGAELNIEIDSMTQIIVQTVRKHLEENS
ncbi:MAG TPA: riboflavin synthase subunit alpha [Candidatus Poseidoniales archaeon]|nr:MAG TPA: riboflavin synthase subunit alpha [Candidatus Poseidoniales archaeon]|tara:strand:+ start:1268 stop:1867 length:600 start_codon:yes stop_codon:yes gene_type:complete